ncbi:hypothetical protein KM915_20765 [Cytobacillus oceanisediminis]|uniref:hypothetical protein n=1 Tax=Cytobacillus oceanisediminis TaxID=665099 RepID=UPI001C246968|nr:hypothetical protein [Cytobacillus oceanisediminis]MBU8732483.1 hypothetical protein [Cytobacillus oceanisediminis]
MEMKIGDKVVAMKIEGKIIGFYTNGNRVKCCEILTYDNSKLGVPLSAVKHSH